MKSQFLLNPSITYLNHGSFGACPKPVFENYQQWQRELESEPVQFILKNAPLYLKQSKIALGEFIDCDPDDFFFVPNPTVAMNTVIRSLKLNPGDEILATDQEYGAMDKTWEYYCKKSGAKYIRQNISIPILSKQQILDEFWSGYSDNTKIVFINQISSVTALIFPVKEICDRAKDLGLITIVDGAHVPGHIPLSICELNPDFYTGCGHKWLLTPKGNSFLYIKKEFQKAIDPLVVSWFFDNEKPDANVFPDYHENQGTRDISAFLTIPAAIKFWNEYDMAEKTQASKNMILANYQKFCDLVNSKPICPITSEFLGQMCSIPIRTNNPLELKELLFQKYKIEIPVMAIDGKSFLRISLNVYNSQKDLDALVPALKDIIATTSLIDL